MATSVRPEERLFSLVLALVATTIGLTKAQIFSTVHGYVEQSQAPSQTDALNRKFERDKDQLREMGVPLKAIPDPEYPDDNQLARYSITKAAFEIGREVTFTPAEVAMLAAAGLIWRNGSTGATATTALTKLRALGTAVDTDLLGELPSFILTAPLVPVLNSARADRQQVAFDYLTPGHDVALTRRVLPLEVLQFNGRWHLYAFDLDRAAKRTFLLERVLGGIRTSDFSGVWDWSTSYQEEALADLAEFSAQENQTARLLIDDRTEAAARLGKRGTRLADGSTSIHYTDLEIFAAELAGYGPELIVTAPSELRERVVAQLQTIAGLHSDGSAP